MIYINCANPDCEKQMKVREIKTYYRSINIFLECECGNEEELSLEFKRFKGEDE